MKLSPQTEEKIKKIAINYLERGKPDWDIPHTLRTVYWMKELIKKEGGNEKILVTAMYLHDIGYPQLQKGYDFDELIKAKQKHTEIGAIKAREILKSFEEFSDEEINEICNLILKHDEKEIVAFRDINKKEVPFHLRLVIEADGLAKIDWYKVTPNFDKENTARYFEFFKKRTLPCFRTETGKKFLEKVMKRAEDYLKNM